MYPFISRCIAVKVSSRCCDVRYVLIFPAGPTGYTYVANNRMIVRHSITGSHHSIVLNHLGSVVDLAVDYKNNVVSCQDMHKWDFLGKGDMDIPSVKLPSPENMQYY